MNFQILFTYRKKIFFVVILVSFIFLLMHNYLSNALSVAATSPRQMYNICIIKNGNEQIISCLKNFVKDAYQNYSLKQIDTEFQDINTDLEKKWCHQTMHYLGSTVYSQTQSLPTSFSYALNNCDNGMYHGIVESFLQKNGTAENIPQLIQSLCDEGMQNRSLYSQGYLSLCYHGLGHGLMLFTGNNLEQSLDYCDLVIRDTSNQCRNAVYMEYTNSHSSDTKVIDLQLCNTMPDKHKNYCLNRYGSQSLGNSKENINVARSTCALIPKIYREDCLSGIAEAIRFDQGSTAAATQCKALHEQQDLYSKCIFFAISFFARIDRGGPANVVNFCSFFYAADRKICVIEVRKSLEEWLGTSEKFTLACLQFSEKEDQNICLNAT